MQNPAQRVGVFVDVQNMYYSARALYDQRVDFGEILKEAVGNRQLVRAFAYVIKADKDEEQTFFDALAERGYELRMKDLLNFYGGNQKGDWDVGLAMDVVRMAPKLDAVVLVSGDGDFAELLKYVKALGCRAEVMAFGSSASSQLREVADSVLDLSEDTKKFLISSKKRSGVFHRSRSGDGRSEPQTGAGTPDARQDGRMDVRPREDRTKELRTPVPVSPALQRSTTPRVMPPTPPSTRRSDPRSTPRTTTPQPSAPQHRISSSGRVPRIIT